MVTMPPGFLVLLVAFSIASGTEGSVASAAHRDAREASESPAAGFCDCSTVERADAVLVPTQVRPPTMHAAAKPFRMCVCCIKGRSRRRLYPERSPRGDSAVAGYLSAWTNA